MEIPVIWNKGGDPARGGALGIEPISSSETLIDDQLTLDDPAPSAAMFEKDASIPAGRSGGAIRLLLVGFRLPHDFLGREIDAAGREGIADEEIVGLIGEEILTCLEVRVLDDRQRQLDRLRDDIAFKR